jgi:hypothetical protein
MASSTTLWLIAIVAVAIFLASRWMRGRSSTEIEQSEDREQVHLLVRSVKPPTLITAADLKEAVKPPKSEPLKDLTIRTTPVPLAKPEKHPAVELAPSGPELNVSRYYFRETSLENGPADPADFYDEMFVELRDPKTGQDWKNSMHVATPRGLERTMAAEKWETVIGGELLIVRRYDLLTILNGATSHLQEIYETRINILGVGAKPTAN